MWSPPATPKTPRLPTLIGALLLTALATAPPTPAAAQESPASELADWADSHDALPPDLDEQDECGADCDAPGAVLAFGDDAGPYPLISIQPYFEEGSSYAQARGALAAGDCGRALAQADSALTRCDGGEGQNAILLVRSHALWCQGSKDDALELVARLDHDGYPGMEREVRTLHRDWARALGQPVPDDLEPQLAWDGDDFLHRALGTASALARDGQLDAALRMLDELAAETRTESGRQRVLLARADLLQAAGRKDDAAAVLFRLRRDNQGSAFGERLEARLAAIERATPRARLSRAERLDHLLTLSSRKGKRAADAYIKANRRALTRDGRTLKAIELWLKADRLENERRREDALVQLQLAHKLTRDPVVLARILFTEGRVLRRLNRDDDAIALYTGLAERYPRDDWADDALLQAARLSVYLGRYQTSIDLTASLVALYPDSPLVGAAVWQGAWAAFLDGQDAKALTALAWLARFRGQETDRSGLSLEVKAHYWRARMLARTGHDNDAVDLFRFVIERFPLTYYAAMAYHQIAALHHDPRSAVPFQPAFDEPLSTARLKEFTAFGQVAAHPRARHGLELWRTGRRAEAKQALWDQLQFNGAPRGVVELVASFHLMDGNIPASTHIATRYGAFRTAPYEGNARLWGLAYPAPPNILDAAVGVGHDIDLDPLIALAIIRHESSFRNDATSPVGAIGLMQVIPDTARHVSNVWYHRPGPGRGQLRGTNTNVRMGMTLLRLLGQVYHGNLPLMIAGYNAGHGISSRWWKQFHALETDALVEQMTYPLTRAYVKKVLGSYYAYRVLYGDGTPPPIPLTLPANLGDWGPPASDLVGSLQPELDAP